MCVRLCNGSNHASSWRLVIIHGKTAQGSLGYVYVLESVGHLTADNTLEKILKMINRLKIRQLTVTLWLSPTSDATRVFTL